MSIFDQSFRALDRTARDARLEAALTESNALVTRVGTTLDEFQSTAARITQMLDNYEARLNTVEYRINNIRRAA